MKIPQRVVLIGPAHPFRGGIAQHTSLLFQALADQAEVTLLGYKRLYPAIFFPGKNQFDDSESTFTVPGRRIVDPLNPVSWFQVWYSLRRNPPDIVIIQWWHAFFGPCLGTMARLLKRFTGAKIIFVGHNVLPHDRHWGDRALSRFALSSADRIVVHGDSLRREMQALLPGANCTSHPHPIYHQFGMTGCTQDQARSLLGIAGNIVLFFGLVRPYKGLDCLIRALSIVRKKADIHLVIAGEFYEPVAPYRTLIHDLGLDRHVTVVDRYIPNEEVERYFAACDVVACPYIGGSQSGVIHIAYAFEKPVICTDVGSLPDAVIDGETGYVTAAGDPDALARSILAYYGSAQDFAAHIRSHTERSDWQSLARALIGGMG